MNFDIHYDKWFKINFSFMNYKEDKIVTIGISELNKPKKEITIKSTLIEGMLQFNKGKFFENFQGNFSPISCYFFEYPRISFEGNIGKKNIFNLGNNVYWKNNVDDEKNNKELITNNNYKYNIYYIGGINFILPLFEKLLIINEDNEKENENKKTIFLKLLNLIKEILIGKPYNVINAHDTQFFELLGLFIQKLDNIYFENDIFHKFLFELSEDLIKQTKSEDKITNKKLNENDIESFYISLFFKYEIIIKVFNEDLNEYFDYINKNENNSLYKFMKFNVCGKFLNNFEKYKEKICPFIKMLIKHLIEIKNDNLNNLIYFVFKNYSNEELIYFILKTFIEQLINAESLNSILDFNFLLYLSVFKINKIEIKFLIIKIFQLLYLKKNKEINEILSQKGNLTGQMFYFILLHFFECTILLDKSNSQNEINNQTPNGNSIDDKNITKIETDKGINNNIKEELMLKIIKKYLIFSIHYIGSFNFYIENPKNIQFELYIKIISEDLEELIEKTIENKRFSLFKNEITKKCLLNIYLYSMDIISEINDKNDKTNENLKSYLIKIIKSVKSLLIKIIVEEINNNIGFINKESKEKNDSYGFKTYNLLIRKIFKKKKNLFNLNIIFPIIDELMCSSFSQITKIEATQFQSITTMKIKNNLYNGFEAFFNNLLVNSVDILKTLKQSNPKKKYLEIKKSIDKKKNFIDFIKKEYFRIENNNSLNKKIENLIKILNIISMTFTQFFLRKK